MTSFTIRSWNNTNPEHFDNYEAALEAAQRRQATEGTLVKVRDNRIGNVQTVGKYGLSGSNNDEPLAPKQIIADACDEIEDR